MKIIDLYREAKEPLFSVELTPPRNGGNVEDLYRCVEAILPQQPAYFSVTHGSGGSLRGGTLAICHQLDARYQATTLAHLTCVDSTAQDIENEMMNLRYLGLENVLAIRGDPPWGESEFKAMPGGHLYASDLVRQIVDLNRGRYLLRANDREFLGLPKDADYKEGMPTDVCIAVAGYPEGHIECDGKQSDIANQKLKMDAGGEYIVTQMIFDAGYYSDYSERCRKAGIDQPIIPGIFPPTAGGRVQMAENAFKATVPDSIKEALKSAGSDREAIEKAGIEQTVRLALALLEAGAPGLHFYSMNNGPSMARILAAIRKAL